MNTLFWVALIVEALFGLGFVFVPAALLGPYGVSLDATATTLARLFGSALLSFPVLLWFALRSDKPDFRKGTVYSLTLFYLVSSVVLVIAQLANQMNALGWVVIAIQVILLVWFGYFLLRGSGPAPSAVQAAPAKAPVKAAAKPRKRTRK